MKHMIQKYMYLETTHISLVSMFKWNGRLTRNCTITKIINECTKCPANVLTKFNTSKTQECSRNLVA